ncbi:uncharacterized protein LOC144861669 [Branchiostoma floridae x Branchiostoma japonicum]
MDSFPERLNPFNIHIGESDQVTSNPQCGGDHEIDVSQPSISVSCNGMQGRYVGIRIEGRDLTMCEVQVFPDIDECATGNGGCSQNCNNTVGSFTCFCHDGYTLNSDGTSCDVTNIAEGKTAFQTSTYDSWVASLAVDGNTDTNFYAGSCTHTETAGNPSWWVDLGQSYVVDRVVIFNRMDSFPERLNPFNIHIGESDQVTSNPQCGGEHEIDVSQPSISVSCNGMQGRYVGIRIEGRDLTMCEVQVFPDIDECATGNGGCSQNCSNTVGSFTCSCHDGYALNSDGTSCDVANIAQGKTAFQTSTYDSWVASLAVDGNTDTNFYAGSCTHTETAGNPSWWVDLGQSYVVDRVVIFNRMDSFPERLNPFNIHIGESDQVTLNPQCGGDHEIDVSQPSISVSCNGMQGRYVGIRIEGRDLTMCEVQVFPDIDECATANGGCSQNCSNTVGSFTCSCHVGYNLNSDGVSCDDVDECASNNGGCEKTCTNNVGSFKCSCDSGLTLNSNNLTCDDIDECATGNGGCSQNCSNTVGSFTCSCHDGYALNSDGTSCDVANIAQGKTAFQTSTYDSWVASLAVDGNTDTNFYAGSCTHTETAGNPSWWVDLGQSYVVDRVVIFNRMDSFPERLNPFNIHIGESDQVTSNPQCGGDHEIDVSQPSISVSCNGMQGRYVGIRIEGRDLTMCEVQVFPDIDECATTNGGCSQNCSNTVGSFACSCHDGYSLNSDGLSCDDVDECASNNGGCEKTCTNNVGSFKCSCDSGLILNSNNLTCDDIDECADANGGCEHVCTNTEGSFQCSCLLGAKLDDKHVVFGSVVEGMDVVKKIESYGSETGSTKNKIAIADCGQL